VYLPNKAVEPILSLNKNVAVMFLLTLRIPQICGDAAFRIRVFVQAAWLTIEENLIQLRIERLFFIRIGCSKNQRFLKVIKFGFTQFALLLGAKNILFRILENREFAVPEFELQVWCADTNGGHLPHGRGQGEP